jgi:hypothetical protein
MAEQVHCGQKRAFKKEWKHFLRALKVHTVMEEKGMFPLFNEMCEGAPTKHGLDNEHLGQHPLEHEVTLAAKNLMPNKSKLIAAFDKWSYDHLHHLKREEDILMPLVSKSVPAPPSPPKLSRVFHDRILAAGVSTGDFDWFVGYVVKKLSTYGSTDQPAKVATRVFVWGLQYASSPDQWSVWLPIIKMNTPDDIYQYMVREFKIEEPGKVSGPPPQ